MFPENKSNTIKMRLICSLIPSKMEVFIYILKSEGMTKSLRKWVFNENVSVVRKCCQKVEEFI